MESKMTTVDADASLRFLTFEIYSLLTGKVHIAEARCIRCRGDSEEIDWDQLFEMTDYILMEVGIDIYEYRCDMTPQYWITARAREWGVGVRWCRSVPK